MEIAKAFLSISAHCRASCIRSAIHIRAWDRFLSRSILSTLQVPWRLQTESLAAPRAYRSASCRNTDPGTRDAAIGAQSRSSLGDSGKRDEWVEQPYPQTAKASLLQQSDT